MAPSPEYDKEPKAPDKNAANSLGDELKISHGAVSVQTNSDNKTTTAADNVETEEIKHPDGLDDGQWRALLDEAVPYNKCPKERDGKANLFKENKHVETLDDGQLRALLDEAITYKCPKDREGKSSLFKELLEEVEQDEQACEAACAGGAGGARGWGGRNARGLNACGSNSLQDLVAAALAAEAPPRRRHAPVSARTHHGGSLPSGVDRSFLLGEEQPVRMSAGIGAPAAGSVVGPAAGCSGSGGGGGGGGGAEYVATVRCVNPTPLTERRVSASDAHNATEMELLNRRSKMPMFPAMYTARTTLEIGSGSVCSGRAVTTTTASNQVRTRPRRHAPAAPPTCGPPERLYAQHLHKRHSQQKLLTALNPRAARCGNNGSASARTNGGGRLPHNVHTDRRDDGSLAADADELALDHRGRRQPRGPVGPPGPHYAEGAYVPKRYSVEAYCKMKCKEDRSKTHPDAAQDHQPRKQSHVPDPVPHKKFSRFDNSSYNSEHTYHNNTNQAPHSNTVHGHAQRFRNKAKARPTDCVDNAAFASKQGSDTNVVFTEPNKLENVDVYNVQSNHCVPKNVRNASLGSPIEAKYWQRHPAWGSCENIEGDNDIVTVTSEGKTDLGVIKNDHSSNLVNSSKQGVSISDGSVEGSNEVVNIETDFGNNACHSSLKRQSSVSCGECKIDIESPDFSDNVINTVPIPIPESDSVASGIDELKSAHVVTNLPEIDKIKVKMDSEFEGINSEHIVNSNSVDIGPNSALDDAQSQDDDMENLRRVQRSIISLKDKLMSKSNSDKKSELDRIVAEAVDNNIEDANSDIEIVNSGDHSRTTYTVVTFPVYEPTADDKKTPKLGTEAKTDGGVTAAFSKTAFVLLPYTRENDERLFNLKPLSLSDNANLIPNSLLPILSGSDVNNASTSNEILIFEPSRSESEGLFPTNKTENAPQVDAGVPFSCITTPEVVASCNTTSSSLQSALAVDPKPRSVIASSFNGFPLARTSYGATAASAADDYKKSLDENGNAVPNLTPLCSSLYGSSQHKKPRRKKSSKNETIIDLNLVDGYRGDKDVTELLRFIEPDAEHGRGQKLGRLAKHRDDDKKRSSERRAKDRETRLQRASSLEELSRTKLEDLTDRPAQPPAPPRHKKEPPPAPAHKSERRSWGDDSRDSFYYDAAEEAPPPVAPEPSPPPAPEQTLAAPSAPPPETVVATPASPTGSAVPAPVAVTPPAATAKEKKKTKSGSKSADSTPAAAHESVAEATVELMDFTTVTNKKKKPRKRFDESERDGSAAGDLHYRKPKPASPERRRKSAPPSDKSNDSNDDMDSVHSLPADTALERSAAVAPSGGSTPQVSYADIARTRHNIPDLIESCNYYTDADAASGAEDKSPRRRDAAPASPASPPDPAIVEAVRRLPADEALALAAHSYDSENYPALDSRTQRAKPKEGKASPPHKRPDKKCRSLPDERAAHSQRAPSLGKSASADEGGEAGEEGAAEGAGGSPPDVVADRRPPVILLDEAQRPRDMDGITFGFDINEQLLNGEGEGCDLVPGVPVRAGLRYLPPRVAPHNHHHDLIVHYVGSAWEDIVRCGSGKVRYFSE